MPEASSPRGADLYWHMNLRRMIAKWRSPGRPPWSNTARTRLDQPFHQRALLEIAERALAEGKFGGAQAEKRHHAKSREFNHLSHQLGVKVVHPARAARKSPISPNKSTNS